MAKASKKLMDMTYGVAPPAYFNRINTIPVSVQQYAASSVNKTILPNHLDYTDKFPDFPPAISVQH